jgi:ATP-binding cassette subfamily F protein 3
MGQRQEGLDPDRDALATMLRSAPAWSRSEALAHLARFRFTGDLVERPVAQLSGGERSRLALACLVAEGANLLALDEPTNHLDLPGQEALQQALAEFSGTVLMASHDRYLISALATQIWRLEPEAEAVEVFRGGYAEMMARPASSPPPRARHSALPARRRAAPPRLEALEARIASLEEERARAVAELERAGSDLDQVRRWGTACAELEQELERQYALWEETARREEPA